MGALSHELKTAEEWFKKKIMINSNQTTRKIAGVWPLGTSAKPFYLTSSLMNGKMRVKKKNHYSHIWKLEQISMRAENFFSEEEGF